MIKVILLFFILTQTLFAIHPVRDAYKWVNQEYKEFRTYPRIDRAYKHIEKGEDKQARELLEKSLEIDPLNSKALNPLISLCLKYNDKECIRKYISYLKDSDLAYFNIYNAEEKIDSKDYVKARKYALEALKYDLKPHDRYYAKLILIEANIKLKNFDEASLYIDKLYYNEKMPRYDKYHRHLVRLSIEIGRLDLGKAQVKKFLEAGNIPTDEQLLKWSKISDNLDDTKFAYFLASKLSPIVGHLEWQVDLLTKMKNYSHASKKMELVYKKQKTTKNKKRLIYLYTLSGKEEKIVKIYEDKLKKRCDEYSLLYLLDYYEYDKNIQEQLLKDNYPYSCVENEKKVDLTLEYVVFIEGKEPQEAKRILLSLEKDNIQNKIIYIKLSNVFATLGDCKNSKKYAQKYLEFYPNNTQALKNAGYCYAKSGKNGMAGYYLSKAFEENKEDMELVKSLGYIYSDLDRPRKSLRFWTYYLNYKEDTKLRLACAEMFYRLDAYNESTSFLKVYDKNKGNKNFEYFALKAKLAKTENNCDKASLYYEKALELKSSEYLGYEYVLLLQKCKQIDKSVIVLEKLIDNNPQNLQYKKELAYTYKKLNNNKKAEEAFKNVVDNITDEEASYVYKREIRAISKRFDVYFAQTFRLDNYTSEDAQNISSFTQATYDGSGGLTIGYRPEYFEDYLSVFGEVVHGHDSSLKESAQVSLGFKYKPFKEYGWVASVQKNFKREELLVRTSASFFDGYEYKFSPKKYYYQNLYLDAGYFTKAKSTILFANYEFGKVYKVYKQASLLPYVTTGGSFTNDNQDKDDVSRLDIGVGISMLNWFADHKYESYMFTTRLKLEARAKYLGTAQDTNTVRLQLEFIY